MKWVKTFESYDEDEEKRKYWDDHLNKISDDNRKIAQNLNDAENYYKLLSENEASNLFQNFIDFEDGEIEKVRNLFSNKYTIRDKIWKNYDEGMVEFTVIFIEAIRQNFWIKIWKLPDEYYLVGMGDDHGRIFDLCDQFEGLVYLINHIGAGVDPNPRWKKTFELFQNDDKRDCISVLEHQLEEWRSNKHLENFTQEEIYNIHEWFDDVGSREKIIMGEHTFNYEIEFGSLLHINANVRKYDDEWFVVTYYESVYNSRIHRHEEEVEYYLCDQIDGLKTFSRILKNKISKNYKLTIKNESISTHPARKVPRSEYINLQEKKGYEKFTKYEIDQIRKSIPESYMFIIRLELGPQESIGSTGSIKKINYQFSKFFIEKLSDEYFTIQEDMGTQIDIYWIADGFDELISWIKENV